MKNGDTIGQDITQVVHVIAVAFFVALGLMALYFIAFGIVMLCRRIFRHEPAA